MQFAHVQTAAKLHEPDCHVAYDESVMSSVLWLTIQRKFSLSD